jgi:hypothetical protein
MRKLFIIFAFLLSYTAIAQDFNMYTVNLIGGKQFSTFTFKNSENQKDETLKYVMLNAFGINGALENGRHNIRLEAIFRQAGAKTIFNGNQMNWKMNYMNFNIGYLYSIIDIEDFKLQSGIAFGIGYMLNGEQEYGNVRLDIKEEASMIPYEFSGMGILNGTVKISSTLYIGLEYRYGIGLNHIENDANNQKTRNLYHGVMLSLGISL